MRDGPTVFEEANLKNIYPKKKKYHIFYKKCMFYIKMCVLQKIYVL